MDNKWGHSRDHILGRAPRDPFATGKAPVDFSDVFGGPPRRLSGPPDASGAGACALGVGRVGGVEEDGEHSRRWSASVAEKPVFGGVGIGSPAHQRHLGDDFFSDIFRGSESACPTPRKERDLFPPSTPSSRVLSPARALPPTSDVFGGVSSLPAHLSYSSRLAKSFDYPSFRSPTASTVRQHEESIPDVFSFPSSTNACPPASPRQISLSNKASHSSRQLGTMASASDGTGETDEQLKKVSTGSKAYDGSGHFHFSIYKWASKRVTLILPSNFKEKTRSGSRLGAVSSQVWHREDLPLDDEAMVQGIHCSQNQSEVEDKIPFNDLASGENGHTGSSNEVTETLPAASDMKSDTSVDTGSCIRDSRGLSEEDVKPRLKNLQKMINENSDGEEIEGIIRQTKKKEGLINDCKTGMKDGDGTAKVKQETRKNNIFACAENATQERHGALENLDDKVLPARAKGRVKEFIKIFNQEATEKASDPVETQTRGPKVKERVEDCASACMANSDKQNNCNYVEASSAPISASQSLKEEEHKTSIKGMGVEKVGDSVPERSATSFSLSGSTLDSLDSSFCNMEEIHFENIEECLVEELLQDHNEVTDTDVHQEEIETKMSGMRIQEWSKGKEGNIRSLLSTLQYVMWPGCGWKPVPLVDIIEGASVRRAYQKALLCLHPDKLQQKGAEAHQKYIAEKVYDILQEAWDHFNSLSSL